ncbi:MAG TPA: hypothetical protein VEL75_11425 [Candidatus Methylomirabilis sp.]|nr:hypothetical protein [Candidatus Methylomirabilis sp.]
MRKLLTLGVLLSTALLGWAGPAGAGVNVNIGINLTGPPQLAAVPATPVMYAPAVGANYFFYGGQYYVFAKGVWYVSRGYNGPWVALAPEFVPRPMLVVPVAYYRLPPPAWRAWTREMPPRWEARWGRRWVEHPDRAAIRHEEHREEEHR